MHEPTTHVMLNRELAETMIASVRQNKLLATEVPHLFPEGAALKYAGAEVVLGAAIDRISYLERRPAHAKQTLRKKLAAHLAFPGTSPRAW